jgi:hypothetical protein
LFHRAEITRSEPIVEGGFQYALEHGFAFPAARFIRQVPKAAVV